MKYDQFYNDSKKETEAILQEINFSDKKFIFSLFGSCQRLVKWFLDKEGISKNLIGIYMPYSRKAINDYTQFHSSSYVNSLLTSKVSKDKYDDFSLLNSSNDDLMSIAVSSSLKTKKHKRYVSEHKGGTLISLKYQKVEGTAEEKIPFEFIKLQNAINKYGYNKAIIVLCGDEGWTLKDTYLNEEFVTQMKAICPDVVITDEENFRATV